MSQTFDYEFTDPGQGTVDLSLTAGTTTTNFGYGPAYAVTAISGSIDGVAITNEVGNPAEVQYSSNGAAIFDNAVFGVSPDGGVYGGSAGSSFGLDVYGLEFSAGGTEYNLFETNGTFEVFATDNPSPRVITLDTTDAPCFCAGTMVLTARGEVAVEELAVGDLVSLADGGSAPICWIGRRAVSTRFADPLRVLPIRIKAHALGDNMPARDLLISPDHALLVDGLLVQAGALVNGMSILREKEAPETFTYYHVEVAEHALILAENAPAETFIDNVGRMAFDNWEEHEALNIQADMVEMSHPRAKSARQVPQAIRDRLRARAESLFGKLSTAA